MARKRSPVSTSRLNSFSSSAKKSVQACFYYWDDHARIHWQADIRLTVVSSDKKIKSNVTSSANSKRYEEKRKRKARLFFLSYWCHQTATRNKRTTIAHIPSHKMHRWIRIEWIRGKTPELLIGHDQSLSGISPSRVVFTHVQSYYSHICLNHSWNADICWVSNVVPNITDAQRCLPMRQVSIQCFFACVVVPAGDDR